MPAVRVAAGMPHFFYRVTRRDPSVYPPGTSTYDRVRIRIMNESKPSSAT